MDDNDPYMSISFFIKQGIGDGFPNKQNLLDMQPIGLKSSRFRFVLSQDPACYYYAEFVMPIN